MTGTRIPYNNETNSKVDQDKEAEKARKSEEKNARKEAKEKRKSGKYESTGAEPTAPVAGVSGSAVEPEEPDAAEPLDEQMDATETAVSRPVITEPSGATGATTAGLLSIGDKPPRAAPRPPVTSEPQAAHVRTSMEDDASLRMREIAARANADDEPNGKVKKWFNRFSRRLSRGSERPVEREAEKPKQEGFVGGAALASPSGNNSTTSLERPASVRDVALAGKGKEPEPPSAPREIVYESTDHCILEDLGIPRKGTAKETDDGVQEARDGFDETLATPPAYPAVKEASPVRDSRFIEEI